MCASSETSVKLKIMRNMSSTPSPSSKKGRTCAEAVLNFMCITEHIPKAPATDKPIRKTPNIATPPIDFDWVFLKSVMKA